MKNRWMRLVLALASLFLVVGMVFCVLRPAYVREAVQILLKNELEVESEDDSAEQESSTAPEESEGSSSEQPEE